MSEFFAMFLFVFFSIGVEVVSDGDLFLTSLAVGLIYMILFYMLSSVSDCHFNPAVSLSMFILKKLSFRDFLYYFLFQALGSICGMTLLFFILSNTNLGTAVLGANYYGEMSISEISLLGAFCVELFFTFFFVFFYLTLKKEEMSLNLSGILLGISLILIHLLDIPFTGVSINPARSIAPALFLGGTAFNQLWLFILSPLLGGASAAYLFNRVFPQEKKKLKKLHK